MPYIKPDRRDHYRGLVEEMSRLQQHPGDLNYLITELVKTYFNGTKRDYQAINDVVGALEGAKLEFYRRVAAIYEDDKAKENGDVY